MKLHQYLPFAIIGIFSACQPRESKTVDHKTPSTTKQSCYAYFNNKDTASLTIITSGHVITGELSYRLFEKDGNKGTMKGEMRGDTLVADYLFDSEGRQSTRQVAFLKKGGKLLEGYGEITEKQGKIIFNDISTLKFGDGIIFTEVNCQ
ncbi:hypothetical protein [Pedobacter insulae]|uniref:Lipoprotein n=1 Tax=Pedobacter insulae TaxID=414048 RepID=A0A1I2VY36_9SPHI|nr:hypothetical protein [Pedobacter insulae]SFG94095.1 hypothetical protein SAMN04489864_103347 [Pedobacter insulae]